jgi:hypothetical protein
MVTCRVNAIQVEWISDDVRQLAVSGKSHARSLVSGWTPFVSSSSESMHTSLSFHSSTIMDPTDLLPTLLLPGHLVG